MTQNIIASISVKTVSLLVNVYLLMKRYHILGYKKNSITVLPQIIYTFTGRTHPGQITIKILHLNESASSEYIKTLSHS